MKEEIIKYIVTEISDEFTEELDLDDDLLGNGIIDSIGMIKLISFLQETYNIEISSEDMTVENFMTVRHIMEYLAKQQSQ